MSIVDQMIQQTLTSENAPVTSGQFTHYRAQVDFVLNLLQQQIISLDVTCGLLMERFGSDWTQEQRDDFKSEVGRRVKAIADDMVKKQKESEKKVHLV